MNKLGDERVYHMYKKLLVFLLCILLSTPAYSQLLEEFDRVDGSCCLPIFAQRLVDQMKDWNQLSRYWDENQALMQKPHDSNRVVFMGDSITDFWKLAEHFPGRPYVNRGISGQTTPQMLVRMYPDVVAHKPAAMVVLAGINDISQNTGPATARMVEQNIMAMTDIARHNGIKVILCSILPVSDYAFFKMQAEGKTNPYMRAPVTATHPPEDIIELNAWMKNYAEKGNAIYVDYFREMVDEKGFLKENLSEDGIHPNVEGYRIMTKIVGEAIEKAL